MANNKLRVCIVGTGARGNAHAKAWAASGEADVVAVVDVLADRAQELAAAYDAPHVFTDYHEAVQRDDIDVVSICTPAFYHEEVTVFAAEHGKHMLSEKPLAMRLDQADRMIAVLEKTGVVFVVNFQSRFGDAPAAVRQCYRDHALGSPLMFRMHAASSIRPKIAMHDMERGNGGPLNDFMCHYFDYWRWLTGSDPVRVSAQGFTLPKTGRRLPTSTGLRRIRRRWRWNTAAAIWPRLVFRGACRRARSRRGGWMTSSARREP